MFLALGVALRAALRLAPPDFDDAELVTPLTSARSVSEGCSFLRRGLSPYGTPPSACRHAPILLHADGIGHGHDQDGSCVDETSHPRVTVVPLDEPAAER